MRNGDLERVASLLGLAALCFGCSTTAPAGQTLTPPSQLAAAGSREPFPVGSRRMVGSLACEPRPELPEGTCFAGTPCGELPKEDIRAVLRNNIRAVQACYQRGLAAPPHPQGTLMTRFSVAPDGKVPLSCVVHSELRHPAIEDCILAEMLTWSFPKPDGGGWVVVDYPFVLTP
jgi:hypothetical protein